GPLGAGGWATARLRSVPARRFRRGPCRGGGRGLGRACPWGRRRRSPPPRPPRLSCSRRWRPSRPPQLRTTYHASFSCSFLLRFGKETPAENGLEARQRESG